MSQTQQVHIENSALHICELDELAYVNPQNGGRRCDELAINTFINTWHGVKDRRSLDFSWTDRTEYHIIQLDHIQGQAILCPVQEQVLRRIQKANGRLWKWRPGSAKFTVEASTARPYSPQLDDLLHVELNFVRRRKYLWSFLHREQTPFSFNILPDLQLDTATVPENEGLKSEIVSEPEPRIRRTSSAYALSHSPDVAITGNLSAPASPTFKSVHCSRSRLRSIVAESAMLHDHILQDVSTPQTPTCGLQITFSCHDLREARFLHDQMCVLNPIMLAFTAGTPVHRGRLSKFDALLRAASPSTLGCRPGDKTSVARPWRLLYPTYLSLDAPRSRITRSNTNRDAFEQLKAEGLDDGLAMYFSQGFTCAMLSASKTGNDEETKGDTSALSMFEQLTASLNPLVQLKLPDPTDSRSGFRVEFSAMEVQLTDFANAACIFFLALLRFAILGFDLDFRLPPHMVAENIAKAHKEDSILVEKFWWRSVRWRVTGLGFHQNEQPLTTDPEPTLVSIDHIINGDPSRPETVGLSGVLDAYLADVEDDNDAGGYGDNPANPLYNERDMASIARYLAFVRRRAKGTVWTDARFIRMFIKHHEDYREDSFMSSEMWYDLIKQIEVFNNGMLASSL